MKKATWSLLTALAGAVGLTACWLGKQTLESLAGEALKGAVNRAGPAGWGVVFLACGLCLALAGPVVMARENHRRVAQERGPRYCGVEFGVVIVGGLAFCVAGLASLLGWW